MAEDQSYEELLDQNVNEVRQSVRELENPDYRRLLQLEREGKDRKTVKEFLEDNLDEEEVEENSGEEVEDNVEDEDEVEDETEEIVEEIEEETSDGLLGSFSTGSVLAGGVVVGILIGLVAGFGAASPGSMASPGEVQDSVTELFTASGMDASQLEIAEYTQRNGMHYVTVNITQGSGNETQTSSRSYYVSPDGDLLFPEMQSPLMTTPINIEQTVQRIQAQRRAQEQSNQTAGNTTQ